MICKWCGAALKPGARSCPRCRREVPALSDCGGFYDLVPQARDLAPGETEPAVILPPAEEMPLSEPENPVQPIRPVLPPKRKKKNTAKDIVFWLAVVLVLILLIQTISLSGKLADARAELQQLRSREDSDGDKAAPDGSKPNVKPNPLPTEDPEKPDDEQDADILTAFYEQGESTVDFSDEANDHLKSGPLTVALKDLSGETVASITLEIQRGDDDTRQLSLEVSAGEAGWKNLSFVWEDSDDEDHKLKWWNAASPAQPGSQLFPGADGEGESTDVPQYTGSVLDIDWDEKTELNCTVMGIDGEGNQIIVILTGIVIE